MAAARPDGPRGRLITVEGVEGAGKSTQVAGLRAWLVERGVSVVATAEPDGTPLGASLRRILGEVDRVAPLTEALLFAASRAEHVRQVIRPALAAGQVVLCDRYVDSTVAYQGYGRGVGLDIVAELNRFATDGVTPELTLVLDLDVAEGLRRVRARQGAAAACDPFERLAIEFHERVRKGYWAIRDREPDRVVLVDADRALPVVAGEIAASSPAGSGSRRHDPTRRPGGLGRHRGPAGGGRTAPARHRPGPAGPRLRLRRPLGGRASAHGDRLRPGRALSRARVRDVCDLPARGGGAVHRLPGRRAHAAPGQPEGGADDPDRADPRPRAHGGAAPLEGSRKVFVLDEAERMTLPTRPGAPQDA